MSLRQLAAGLAVLLSLFCVQAASATDAPAQASPADQQYILGPADVVEVSVLTHPEYTTRDRISEAGTIQLPYLGSVNAANMTAAQLRDEVADALDKGGYFAHPVVKVDIISFGSRYVTVLGEVHAPGLVPVDRPYRLSEILARVGGIQAGGADYVVLTPANGKEERLAVKDIATGGLDKDPYVQPGDKIYSPPAEVFYVSGQVNAPGAFPIMPGMTIRMAIARAGGVTLVGSEKKVKLTRHGVKTSHVDLNELVQPGDVIVIGQNLFAF